MAGQQSRYPEEREIAKLAALCCAAAGSPIDDMSVAAMALKVDAAIDDESTAVQLLRSAVIKARIERIEYEESSRRYLISFVALNDPEARVETVRSNRTDGARGKAAKAVWGRDLEGHDVLLYKTNEGVGKDPKNAQGYRVSPWCRDLGAHAAGR